MIYQHVTWPVQRCFTWLAGVLRCAYVASVIVGVGRMSRVPMITDLYPQSPALRSLSDLWIGEETRRSLPPHVYKYYLARTQDYRRQSIRVSLSTADVIYHRIYCSYTSFLLLFRVGDFLPGCSRGSGARELEFCFSLLLVLLLIKTVSSSVSVVMRCLSVIDGFLRLEREEIYTDIFVDVDQNLL